MFKLSLAFQGYLALAKTKQETQPPHPEQSPPRLTCIAVTGDLGCFKQSNTEGRTVPVLGGISAIAFRWPDGLGRCVRVMLW